MYSVRHKLLWLKQGKWQGGWIIGRGDSTVNLRLKHEQHVVPCSEQSWQHNEHQLNKWTLDGCDKYFGFHIDGDKLSVGKKDKSLREN